MKTPRQVVLVLVPVLLGAAISIPLMSAAPSPGRRPQAPAGAMSGHCSPAVITPIDGDPGAYRIQTAHGSIIARTPAPSSRLATGPIAEIRVFPASFDADGDTLGTVHDTIVVAPGTTVRWVRAGPGFHTITNGRDSGDPDAASVFSWVFDYSTLSRDTVFMAPRTWDYFCFIHEPVMVGTIIVTSATAGVGPGGVLTRAAFTRPPAPNPTRGTIAFAIALPRATPVSLTVHDLAGRLVGRIQDGVLPAGEHSFRWDGRGANGRPLESGRYFIRLVADDVRETRPVSLVH